MTQAFKVISYNIHKGRNYLGCRASMQQLATNIARLSPDLVLLQEVKLETRQGAQFAYLRDALDMHGAYLLANSTRGHGNAILSRRPIRIQGNLDLTTSILEQRALLHGIIELAPDCQVHVCTAHLDLFSVNRSRQCDAIIGYLRRQIPPRVPLILGGDFNDWRQKLCQPLQQHLRLLETHRVIHGYVLPTYPSPMPLLPLDRIYFRGLSIIDAPLTAASWQADSDHLPVQATFKPIPAQKAVA